MLPRLQKSEYRGGYRIWLQFADGTEGEVDLEGELWGEMFEPLKDKSLFADCSVDPDLKTLVWPNGAVLHQTGYCHRKRENRGTGEG